MKSLASSFACRARRHNDVLDWARHYIAIPAETPDELHIQAIVADLVEQAEAGR